MREKIDFEGSGVIVTGGAGDIGGQTVRAFAEEGADVVVADVDTDRGEALADEATDAHGVDVQFVETDVSDFDACRRCVEQAVAAHGGLDVLVNGASSRRFPREERFQPFVDQSPHHWDAQIEVTMRGAINMSYHALQHMDEGAIITISSESRRGPPRPRPGNTLYATVKSSHMGFTAALAREVGPRGIRVNTVSPGTIRAGELAKIVEADEAHEAQRLRTIPMGRLGEPEDVSDAILFLASDAAAWITGQTISVNGGYL